MATGKVIDPARIQPFVLAESYSSKLRTDDVVAGTPAININEGTLKGGCSTGAGVHEETELYYAVKGEAILHLDEEQHDFKAGMVAVIPGSRSNGYVASPWGALVCPTTSKGSPSF